MAVGWACTILLRISAKVGAGKRSLAGRQFVEDDPQTEDVGAMIEVLAQCLFGAHVAGGSEHLALWVCCMEPVVPSASVRFLRHPLGQAEVEDLDLAPLVQTDVGRLDVAMHDPAGMGGIQRVGHLSRDLDDCGRSRAVLVSRAHPATGLRRIPWR